MSKKLLAVSLKYPKTLDAPLITAKSSGILAKRMIEIAKENNIPIVEDNILANVLSVHQLGECIPEETWDVIAKVFAMINFLESKKSRNEDD